MSNVIAFLILILAVILGTAANSFAKSANGFTLLVPSLITAITIIGCMFTLSIVMKNIPVEVAMIYNTSFSENLHSYVNNINTHEGGTHLAGFRRGLTSTLKKYADSSGMLDKLKFEIVSGSADV